MANINEIIKSAMDLGINLTNAELETELCDAWIDRVLLAKMYFDCGQMAMCQRAIDDANRYAI